MSWISDTLDSLREASAHSAIECPRGWGDVAFITTVWVVPPLFGTDRKCPIGGVGSCESCKYAPNSDAFDLTAQLGELERLRNEGQLSLEEHGSLRRTLMKQHGRALPDGSWQRTTGWSLAIPGLVLALVGAVLTYQVHANFSWQTFGGLVLALLGAGFWGVGASLRAKADAPEASVEKRRV